MKLNPLVVHLDNGWNSEISSDVLKNMNKTKFDFKTIVIDWNEFKPSEVFSQAGVVDTEIH